MFVCMQNVSYKYPHKIRASHSLLYTVQPRLFGLLGTTQMIPDNRGPVNHSLLLTSKTSGPTNSVRIIEVVLYNA